jgi:hypothetical protein
MIMLSRKSNFFSYFRNVKEQTSPRIGNLAPEQIYFFSNTLVYPNHTYSFNIKTIRSHIKIGRNFYVLPIRSPENIFPERFVKLDNYEIWWAEGDFIQDHFFMYLLFAVLNKFNLRRFV